MHIRLHAVLAMAAVAFARSALAQGSTMDEIARYREMLAEGNPAELLEAKGEVLWKKARGPKIRPAAELFLAAVSASLRAQPFDRMTGRDVYDRLVTAEHEPVTDADVNAAAHAIAWVNALTPEGYAALAYYPARTVDCIRTALERGHVNKGEAGPISYLLGIVRAMTQASERTNEPVPGAVPGRTIEIVLTFDRDLRWAVQCSDRAGRTVLLKGITAVTTVHRMEQGAFTARGRVQSIGEYRGTVQTVLTGAEIAFAGE